MGKRVTLRNLVAYKNPANENSAKTIKRHESRINGPLMFDPTGIQHNQTWYTLKSNQGGCCQLPGIVAGIEPRSKTSHYTSLNAED